MSSAKEDFERWTCKTLSKYVPLTDDEIREAMDYLSHLTDAETKEYFRGLLGNDPMAEAFTHVYIDRRREAVPPGNRPPSPSGSNEALPDLHPDLPTYETSMPMIPHHTNQVIEAARHRVIAEHHMQQKLQELQSSYRIYDSSIEPVHNKDLSCVCRIHDYVHEKRARAPILQLWTKAVQYPGEKHYSNMPGVVSASNPYSRVPSVFSNDGRLPDANFGLPRPVPDRYAANVRATLALDNRLNTKAQKKVNALEPKGDIWDMAALANAGFADGGKKSKRKRIAARLTRIRRALCFKPSEKKLRQQARELREAIQAEEAGRWPDQQYRKIAQEYQDAVGMRAIVAELRARQPIQYLHLLRVGYFEPIPVLWAQPAWNPLQFSIDAAAGVRGITPAWRGYKNLAEERLYWVLNHRGEATGATHMKLDVASAMRLARERLDLAVEPAPQYFSPDDTWRLHGAGTMYAPQVMPAPQRTLDRVAAATADTMILLDASGSMSVEPERPVIDQYLVMGFEPPEQTRNGDVVRSILRRFTGALAVHDNDTRGYDLVTFADRAFYEGVLSCDSFDETWARVEFGGDTRVMAGWQLVKERHFTKHSASAVRHPVFGWQAGPATPMLRLLLVLDGEAVDMAEFELELLGLSWAHVTIFLIGVDECPLHHRHANALQRISDANPHVSFVDAQGNCAERFVTHELLKRHLGYRLSLRAFEQLEDAAQINAAHAQREDDYEHEPPVFAEIAGLERIPSVHVW